MLVYGKSIYDSSIDGKDGSKVKFPELMNYP